jgi:hypothetical protein
LVALASASSGTGNVEMRILARWSSRRYYEASLVLCVRPKMSEQMLEAYLACSAVCSDGLPLPPF